MRVARAFRLPIIAAMTALALSGCMHATGPVAMAQPQGDLDSMAYGQTYYQASPGYVRHRSRRTPAAPSAPFAPALPPRPQRSYAPPPVVYRRAAPTPVAYERHAYRLDAGDKLRIVVYGQEGLTNTYAIDAGGSITMPLIGSVPARGRTPAGLAAEITAKLRNGYIREPSVAVEIESYRPFFILGEVAGSRPISLCAQYERRKRGRHRRRLLAARPPRWRHTDPHGQFGFDARRGAARHLDQPGRYRARRRTLVLNCSPFRIPEPIPWNIRDARTTRIHRSISSNAWQKIRRCVAARFRRSPCRSWRALRN